jgi:type IV secretory pathway TraG/TraD family ATPase VirD4
MLIFVAGHAPIRGTQSVYFRDPVFLERSRISPSAVETNGRSGGRDHFYCLGRITRVRTNSEQ